MLDDLEPEEGSSVASIARALERDLGAFVSRVMSRRESSPHWRWQNWATRSCSESDLAMNEQEAANWLLTARLSSTHMQSSS